MAVNVLGIAPSEVRNMTLGEIMAVFHAKNGKGKPESIDYDELLDDLRKAKDEHSRHAIG